MFDSPLHSALRALALSLFLVFAMAATAQQSGIAGTVKDTSGSVLPDAQITVTNINTGEVRHVSSNEVGQYTVPNLKPAVYQVAAEKSGFKRQVVDHATVEVQLVRTVDFTLEVGSVKDEVNVTADATPLQTTDSSVGTVFETKVVDELPLNGRDFLQLQLLSPGVTMGRGGTFSVVQIAGPNTGIGGGNFSVNGMRDVYNDYLLDGTSFKDWIHGTNGMNPSLDAIQEFRTATSNFTAEYGSNAGGLVNMVTKSGTNQFHGSAFEYLRNDIFDAANTFTKKAGAKKTPLRRNQFGATFGGPVIRNRTFFFGSYEGFREQRTSTLIDTFPTQKMHSGDFSELLNQPTPTIIHDPTGAPYPGNIIPANQIIPELPGYLDKYVPLPNRPGVVNNWVVPGTHKNTIDGYIFRIDQSITNNLKLFGRYAQSHIIDSPATDNPNFPSWSTPAFIVIGTGGVSGGSSQQENHDHNITLQLTDTLNPTTVLDFRAGYQRFNQHVVQGKLGSGPNIAIDVLHINGVSEDPEGALRSWYSERFEYEGSASLVRGNHFLKAGLEMVRHHETFPEIIIPFGIYIFDGSFTGYPMADMMLGIPGGYLLSPEKFDPQFRQWETMPWVQDDWRVTRKLTLNLGLRYERRPWPVSRNNTISNLLLPPGGGDATVVLSGPCNATPVRKCETSLPTKMAQTRSTLGHNDNHNFAPRIGFAYQLGESNRTVVRGAYGIFYQGEPFNQFVSLSYNPPFVSFYSRFNNSANYQTWDWYNPTAGLPPGGVQFTYIPENSPSPYLQAWNLSVQRELGAGIVLDVAYVGNKDTHLWARTWPNQPRPGPGDIDSRRPYTNVGTISGDEAVGNSNYNGLQLRGERRFSHGFSLLTSYTWSKAITDSQLADNGSFVPDLQDNYNRRANRGLWSADTRHRFTLSTLYELPFGQGKTFLGGSQGFVGKLVSGWQIGGIATVQSGQPLTVTLASDNPNVGEGAKLPNVVGNPNHGPKTVAEWFNTSAFVTPPQYTFGDEGIGAVTGPGLSDVDFSVIKNTSIREGMRLQFRAEAFNVLNHTILGDPDTTLGSPLFGSINSTRLDNRELQFALRLEF